MHEPMPVDPLDPKSPSATDALALVLREARRLHRHATSDALIRALPVLRRLLASGAVPRCALPELFRRRSSVQRKHLLRLLAVEAGFPSWEAFRPALGAMTPADLPQLELARDGPARLNLWFNDWDAASAHASQRGGRAVRVGAHAVVLPGAAHG